MVRTEFSMNASKPGAADGFRKQWAGLGREAAARPASAGAAFTLLELLVVVGIIAILVGLLSAGLARAKGEAHRIQCLNNTKQFIYAWSMYTDENHDQLPPNGVNVPGGPPEDAWVGGFLIKGETNWTDNTNMFWIETSLLTPYLRTISRGTWRCPSDKSTATFGSPPFGYHTYPRTRSYTMDRWTGEGMRRDSLAHPVATFVFLDHSEDDEYYDRFDVDPTNGPASLLNLPGAYHNRAANLAYADGHAATHRWLDPRTTPPIYPYSIGISGMQWPPNPDVAWLREHSIPWMIP